MTTATGGGILVSKKNRVSVTGGGISANGGGGVRSTRKAKRPRT